MVNSFKFLFQDGKFIFPQAIIGNMKVKEVFNVVGKFCGPRLDLDTIMKWVIFKWKSVAFADIVVLSNGFFMIKFHEEIEM